MRTKLIHIILLGMAFSLLSTGTILATGSHDSKHSDKSPGGHDWKAPPEAVKRQNPIPVSPESIERGKALFATSCAKCHGKDAKGDGPVAEVLIPKPTDLSVMAGVHTDGDFAWKIATGKNTMPGWSTSFTKDQIWDIVNFIQSLKSVGSKDDGHTSHSH